MHYFDSHAHLTSPEAYKDINGILARAEIAGVSRIINICTNAETLKSGLELSKRYLWIHNAAATTPHDVEKEGELLFPLMEKHARNGDLVAVGETGLDYHYEHSSRELQKHFLIKYLHLALECKLPVIIHCRDAFQDFFEILNAEYSSGAGVLHCFTGTLEDAEQVINRGWYLSLSGIVTFKKSEVLKEVAKMVPLEQLLIETDTPYLAPQSKRGKPNEPSYLPEIAQVIAQIKNIPAEEVVHHTTTNASSLFRLSSPTSY